MNSFKKKIGYEELELTHLMAVRQMWRSAKDGLRVCVVSKMVVDWEVILGNYYDVLIKYVNDGLVYLRVEDSTDEDLQLVASDLDNEIIEIAEAI